jgi:hypothetical protein
VRSGGHGPRIRVDGDGAQDLPARCIEHAQCDITR